MLTAIADYVKSRRHELGKHVLFVGSAVRTSPGEVRVDDLLGKMALEWATEQGKELPEEEAELAALEMMARAGAPLAGAEALFPVLVRQPKGTQPYPLGDLS